MIPDLIEFLGVSSANAEDILTSCVGAMICCATVVLFDFVLRSFSRIFHR